MTSQDQVSQDIISHLKAGQKEKAEALKLLKSALNNARIALSHDLSDDEAIKVIRKEIKSRVEARDLYLANDRKALADKEEFERALYSKYVPAELSDEELNKIISKNLEDESQKDNFGKLMSSVMSEVAGRADGARVSALIKQSLND